MIQPPLSGTGSSYPSTDPPAPSPAPEELVPATPLAPSHDPLIAWTAAHALHADVQQLAAQPAGHDPWSPAGGVQHFIGNVVLAGAPLAQKVAPPPPPQKIAEPGTPTLEPGKSSGPIVQHLQGYLNLWHERQHRHQQGGSGWPAETVPRHGRYDTATTQAVKEFQLRMGLKPTGVADAATQHLLKLEGDEHYSSNVSESNKQRVRELVAGAGGDAKRIEALSALFDSGRFTVGLNDGMRAQVLAAIAQAKADPAFVKDLQTLLNNDRFKALDPDGQSAVLQYLVNPKHANPTMSANVLKMMTPTDVSLMVELGKKELQAAQAATDAREPPRALGRNDGTGHLPVATGLIPAAAWRDPIAIVGQLRQTGASAVDDVNARNRCGPANLLAAALLNGPEAAAKFLDNVAKKDAAFLTADERADLKSIAGQLRSGGVSYEDLSLAMDLVYRAGDRRVGIGQWLTLAPTLGQTPPSLPPLSGAQAQRLHDLILKQDAVSPTELREMSQLISKATGMPMTATLVDDYSVGKRSVVLNRAPRAEDLRVGTPMGGLDDGELIAVARAGAPRADYVAYDLHGTAPVTAVFDRLKPGESAVIPLAGSAGSNKPGHYVSVGILKDGRPYIYNPDPAPGDNTLTVGHSSGPQPKAFADELAKYNERANHVQAGIARRAIGVAN